MIRLTASVVLVAVALLAFGGNVLAQPRITVELPSFKLGFKAIADRIPDAVGEPWEHEQYGADGLCIQRTSKGIMVWRKADNWTAFTNGVQTWVNGPFGLQERANGERFDWETAVLPPPAADVGTPALRDLVRVLDKEMESLRVELKRKDEMLLAKDQTISELTKRIPAPGEDKPWWEFWRGWKLW